MIARATAPNAVGPGSVFPDAAKWDFSEGLSGAFIDLEAFYRNFNSFTGSPMALPLFWIALTCQLVIVFGYFWFYRKEQLGMSSLICSTVYLLMNLLQHDHKLALSTINLINGQTRKMTASYGLLSPKRTYIWNLLNVLQYCSASAIVPPS